MNKKNLCKKHLLPLDILIIILFVAAGVFLTIHSATRQKGGRVCVNANGTHYEYSASKDGVYTVQGELGETTCEIKDRRVRIIDSPCPNKPCISQGWHNPLVCLPNKVIISVEGESGKNATDESNGYKKRGKFDAISE